MINMTTGLLTVQVIRKSEARVGSFIFITVRELSARAACIMFNATEINVLSGMSATSTYFETVVDTAVGGNEAPEFSPGTYTFIISENVMDAHVIGMLTVTDIDGKELFSIIMNTSVTV